MTKKQINAAVISAQYISGKKKLQSDKQKSSASYMIVECVEMMGQCEVIVVRCQVGHHEPTSIG